eukprot:XP_014005198.1 PREDICTED: protein Jade-3-like [Salmo salar]
MKRLRSSSSSDSSDNESPSTSFCSSNKYGSKPGTPASVPKKPAEVFRKDLISAMKLPDSHHVSPEDYYLLGDTWRQEWEKGVQVPAFPETVPQPSIRTVEEKPKEVLFTLQKRYIQCWSQPSTETGYVNIKELAEAMCSYDLDNMDLYWLQTLNAELEHMGEGPVDELTLERAMEALERQCHDNMNHAIDTVEGLGIEYDEDVICDVCRSPDSEEGNDMVFCDKCNICVHQVGTYKVNEPIPSPHPSQCSVKNCTIPFHVTCAFEHSLEMKTILDEGDEVKFRSYCLKHSKPKNQASSDPPAPGLSPCQPAHNKQAKAGEPGSGLSPSEPAHNKQPKAGEPGSGLSPARPKPPVDPERGGLRAQRLLELEEEFSTLIHPEELALNLGLPPTLLDFIYQYWKLKRKSNFNRALLPPGEEEDNLLLLPHEDSIHTRMRMFMHLRQDLERVRNLCYMVSRREKLKLSQSKAQEQIFNLHVKLLSQEISAGLPVDSMLFRPPPRITLKLKMPKVSLGNGKTGPKSGNGPLCPDNSGNVHQRSGGGKGLGKGGGLGKGKGGGKPQLHGRGKREECSNGSLLSASGQSRREGSNAAGPTLTNRARGSALTIKQTGKPLMGKPLTLHAAPHGHPSNGNGKLDQEQTGPVPRSNGVMEKMVAVAQKDSSCQTPSEQETSEGSGVKASQSVSFSDSTMEHFSRSFKEATVSLVRTTEDLRGDKLSQGGKGTRSAKDRPWAKPVPGVPLGLGGTRSPPYQETDGYCPDLELSDSEPEAKGQRSRQGRVKQCLGGSSRTSVQR